MGREGSLQSNKAKKLSISSMAIALYVIIVYFTQGISFGAYQIRIATGLYALAYEFPFLVLPLGLANMISNILMGGMGLPDIVGGTIVGIVTSGSVVMLKKLPIVNGKLKSLICVLPIGILPAVIVPLWLSVILKMKYVVLVMMLLPGQFISAYTVGLLIINISGRIKRILD